MRDSFKPYRDQQSDNSAIYHGVNQWCIHAGTDERGYVLTLQRHPTEKEPMIRCGCRYFTLAKARQHYVSVGRNRAPYRRSTAERMLALIGIAVASVNFKGWVSKPLKFNSTPRKVRR